MGSLRRNGAAALAVALAFVASPEPAHADEASGTWTGVVELRNNYYWETSTRVVAPEARIRLVSPDGVQLDAGYLLDAITSASIAAGVQEDIRFTEVRNQGSLGVSRELDLGDAQLRLGLSGRVSHEPDYLATGVTASGALSLFQRSTILSTSFTYVHDNVGSVLRGGDPRVDPATGRDLSDRGRQGTLEALNATIGVSQVLSPVTTLVAGYQLLHNWGFLQNPYRRARLQEGAGPNESHPDRRTRHTVYARLAHFVPETGTAFHVLGRAYVDDWNIAAITPEIRVYQMVGRDVLVRARYRYYTQTESFFLPEDPTGYQGFEPFLTADGKMVGQQSHLAGLQVRVALGFLESTPLDFLERAWLDVSFSVWLREYTIDAFGWGRDAVLAQAGLRTPF